MPLKDVHKLIDKVDGLVSIMVGGTELPRYTKFHHKAIYSVLFPLIRLVEGGRRPHPI